MGKNWLAAARAQWFRITHHEGVIWAPPRSGAAMGRLGWGADAGLPAQSVIHFSTGRLQMTMTDRNE
jgi:hypothetical protein